MNESPAKQKQLEANALVGIRQFLKDFRVPCTDTRIHDSLRNYAFDHHLSEDELRGLNRRFLAYLTEHPEQAIRRYITEEAPAMNGFSEKRSLAVICRLLHERGIERDHDELRDAAVRQLKMRPKLNNLQGVYEAFEQMLTENPIHEFPRIFKPLPKVK